MDMSTDLGELVSTHHGRFFGGNAVGGMLSAFGLGLCCTSFGLFTRNNNPTLAAMRQLAASRRRLDVFDNGLRYDDNGRLVEVTWTQVRSVRILCAALLTVCSALVASGSRRFRTRCRPTAATSS